MESNLERLQRQYGYQPGEYVRIEGHWGNRSVVNLVEAAQKLHEAYRRHMLATCIYVEGVRVTEEERRWSCDCMCHADEAEWKVGETEIHKPDCMAAPDWLERQAGE